MIELLSSEEHGAIRADDRAAENPARIWGGSSPRRAAQLAGAAYVALFILGIFANFVVREGLVVSGDAQATAGNIAESQGLFRLGLVAFLAIFVLDIVISWALHLVFRDTSRDLSVLAACFRLIYTVFLGVAVVFLFQALQLLGSEPFLGVFDQDQLNAQALLALDMFNWTWLIGLMVFGGHLILMGQLVVRSGYAPKFLGYLLMLSGTSYVIDTLAHALLDNYRDFETGLVIMVALPAVIAEGWFGLWLLLRGRQGTNTPATVESAGQSTNVTVSGEAVPW